MITWTSLDQVLLPLTTRSPLQQGWSPQCESQPAEEGNWGVLKTTAIQKGRFVESANKRLPEGLQARPELEVMPGDLLITCAGPRARCGVPALVRQSRKRLMFSGKMYRFRTAPGVDPRFLEYYLLSSSAQAKIDKMKTGISESGLNLTKSRFLALPVPIAPLVEQRRIVEILEGNLSRIDAGEDLLRSTARRGELLELAALDALVPDGAPRASLREVALSAGYGTSTKCVVDGPGTPVVRIPNLAHGAIDLSDEKRAEDINVDLSKLMLNERDLLVVRTNGSRDLIGRTAVVQRGIRASFASYLIRYQLNPERAEASWVHYMMRRPQARAEIERLAASSAGQHNLSLTKLDKIQIPLPSLSMQRELIARYESRMEGPRRLVESAERSGRRAVRLRRAVLTAAFSGGLTGSTPDIDRVEELAGV